MQSFSTPDTRCVAIQIIKKISNEKGFENIKPDNIQEIRLNGKILPKITNLKEPVASPMYLEDINNSRIEIKKVPLGNNDVTFKFNNIYEDITIPVKVTELENENGIIKVFLYMDKDKKKIIEIYSGYDANADDEIDIEKEWFKPKDGKLYWHEEGASEVKILK